MNTPAVDLYRLERRLYHLLGRRLRDRYDRQYDRMYNRQRDYPILDAVGAAQLVCNYWEIYDLEDQLAVYWLAVGLERRKACERRKHAAARVAQLHLDGTVTRLCSHCGAPLGGAS